MNKVAIVTGASSGMGAATAKLFAAEGAKVVLTDILEEEGTALAAEIGENARFQRLDVTSEEDWETLVAETLSAFGRIGILINNAGVSGSHPDVLNTDTWDEQMNVNARGVFLGMRSVIPKMKEAGGGSIVNMSSTAALIGLSPYLAYSAAKGGIRAMTKSIAIHCRSEGLGIRCNSVHPGSISTPMVHKALKSLMGTDLMAEEDPEKTRVALGIGEPEDVANMVLYLLSDESKHVTGAEMVIDNGDTVI